MEEQAVVGTQVPSQDGMYGSRRSRQQKVESKGALAHEDKRVKELTEGILYDFLPAALNVMLPRCEELQELDADRCRAVASAALAVSALMNAPPGFLEFLLCVPWRKLSQLYPKPDSIDKLVAKLQVTDEERRKLVNTRVEPALMPTLLDFLYKEKHAESVPPMLQLTPVTSLKPDDSAPVVSRETVAAVLDGATPLHCAALRGNPAQVDHLLYCGADPTLRTAAGELPIELVPVCGDKVPADAAAAAGAACAGGPGVAAGSPAGHPRTCRCMAPLDQEVWECRSRLARSLIARRCFFSFGVGVFAWVRLVVFCLLCLLGQAGCYTTISRPVVERHIDTRRQQKVAAARARAHSLVTRMRSEAEAGHRHLAQAKRECLASAAFQRGPPDLATMCFTDPTKSPPPPPPQFSQIHDINFHLQESGTSSTGEELPSEKAFKCFVRSVHALQSLDLRCDTVPPVFAELVAAGGGESRETHVLEDEQADLYSCWAESVLLKFRGCTCPGCAALAIQAVRMAHIQATRLFAKVERVRGSHVERWRAVGQALARVVYVHICLLLETEAQGSPTRSLVWRAEQCLREWDRLDKAGLTAGAGVLDPRHVAALQRWAKTADSDLYLAEALHGQSLPPTKTLQEVVQGAVTYTSDNSPILARPVSSEVIASLEQALTLASLPSPLLAHIVRGVVSNAVSELVAAARLRELVGSRGSGGSAPGGGGGGGAGTAEAVAALTEALRASELYRGRLGPEVAAAEELREKWMSRATAVEKLEGAVEEVRAYVAAHPLSFTAAGAAAAGAAAATSAGRAVTGAVGTSSAAGGAGDRSGGTGTEAGTGSSAAGSRGTGGGESGSGGGGGTGEGPQQQQQQQAPDLVDWERRTKSLEAAMNDAKDANVSVTKAKRLLKEMAAIAAAAEAARHLEAVMARRPSGPLQLKLALNRAEAAASALGGLGGGVLSGGGGGGGSGGHHPQVPGLVEVMGPLVAAARRRLDSERAAEALSKAAASFRTLVDLGRLEAAIYNAKKIGAEDLDPESYRVSLELRAQLQEAARGRGALEAALRALQTGGRQEDAEALERALQDVAKWEDLLAADTAKARRAFDNWRTMTACEAKLARLLSEGTTAGVLARAIQEAAAAGVKVQQAKRVLKILQGLEAVLGVADGATAAGGLSATALAAAAVAASGSGGAAEERYGQVKAKLEAAEAAGVTVGPVPEAARRTLARLAALTARESLEAALKPHSDWSVTQRVDVLREALDKAEGVLGPGVVTAPVASATVGATAAAGGGRGGAEAGDGAAARQGQGQAPKLGNGSAAGKTSRGKRSSAGSTTSASGGGGEAAVSGPTTVQAASGTAPGTPEEDAAATGRSSARDMGSDLGSTSGNSSTSGRSSGTSCADSSSSGSGSSSVAVSPGGGSGSGADDDVLRGVRELVNKARQVLEADRAEMARIERERQEAERARKEAQERERQERQRQEQERQERQRRERAEAAERERALSEKREKAKADKSSRQQHQSNHQQHQNQQHKGKGSATWEAASANAAGAGKASGGRGQGSGSAGGKQGASTAAAAAAASASSHPSGAADAGSGGSAGSVRSTAPSRAGSSSQVPAATPPAATQQQQARAASTGSKASGAPAPPVMPFGVASMASAAAGATSAAAIGSSGRTGSAAVAKPSGSVASSSMEVAPAVTAPSVPADGPRSPIHSNDPLRTAIAVAAVGAEGAQAPTVAPPPAVPVTARAVVHTRGDSHDSLGEVVHKLNREVIEALDMDSEAVHAVHGYGVRALSPASGIMGMGIGIDGTAALFSAAVTGVGAGCGAELFYGDVGAAGCVGVAPSITTHGSGGGSGGGSVGRTCSAAAATADSVMDQTPSRQTSSVMSSVASADDVMSSGPVSGAGLVACGGGGGGGGFGAGGVGVGLLDAAGGGSALSSAAFISHLSAGLPSGGSAEATGVTAGAGGDPLSATSCAMLLGPPGSDGTAAAAEALPGGGGGGGGPAGSSGGGNGGGGAGGGGAAAGSKPRFGFVDLGGASWGLDSPMLTVSGGRANLFPSLQPSMADFGAVAGTAAAGGGGGWPPSAAGYGVFPGAPAAAAAGRQPANGVGSGGSVDKGASAAAAALAAGAVSPLGGAIRQQQQQQQQPLAVVIPGVPGQPGLMSPGASAGGSGVGFGSLPGGLQILAAPPPDTSGCMAMGLGMPPMPVSLAAGAGGAGVLSSPRTTVTTTNAGGMHPQGLLHVRQLGGAGGPGGSVLAGAVSYPGVLPPGGSCMVPPGSRPQSSLQQLQMMPQGSGGGGNGAGVMPRTSGFWTPPNFQQQQQQGPAGDSLSLESNGGGGLHSSLGLNVHVQQLGMAGPGTGAGGLPSPGSGLTVMQDWQQQQQPGDILLSGGLHLVRISPPVGSTTMGSGGGGTGPHQQQQPQALRIVGAGGGGVVALAAPALPPSNASTAAAASRICRFFLQGYCRDGERCRFAHVPASALLSAGVATAPVAQTGGSLLGGPGPAPASAGSQFLQIGLTPQQHPQTHLHGAASHGQLLSPGSSGGGPFAPSQNLNANVAIATSGSVSRSSNCSSIGPSSAVGSFAFGAPGAEAFAPLGSTSLSRASTGTVHSYSGEPLTAEQLLTRGSVPQLPRHQGGAGGIGVSVGIPGLPTGLAIIDRAHLSPHSTSVLGPPTATSASFVGAPAGAGSAPGGMLVSSGPGGGNSGQQQQTVQLRDSATGVTFSAVLNLTGTPNAVQQQQQQQLGVNSPQQLLMLSLPDDLTFSPPSSSGLSGSGSGAGQSRK